MFKLKENGTNVRTEVMAGITTFFAMAYIIFVNPAILSESGMNQGGVFVATIIAAIIGTLVMGLFANVPYAQAPGMGLNAFFTYTVCFGMGFTWQQALAMVFICGLINILITITKVRKSIIRAIPRSLQLAIGAGIGLFIAYIGLLNVGIVDFAAGVPAISLKTPTALLALIGLVITAILMLRNVKGAILLGIIITTIIGIPMGVTQIGGNAAWKVSDVAQTAFKFDIGGLFADPTKIVLVLVTIFAFSLTDTFDTIGTFIGTGRKAGIFDDKDESALFSGAGFKSKMDKALFADSIATSVGALFGTSNTTTFVESAAGIGAGGRTGLTSVVTAGMFALCLLLTPIAGIVSSAATAPALIIVGVLMSDALREIAWHDFEEALPAFITILVMAMTYSISNGIAAGFIFYVIVKACTGKAKEVHPLLYVFSALFVLYFIALALFKL